MVASKNTREKTIKLMADIMLGQRGCNSDGFEPWSSEILVVQEKGGRRSMYLADENQVLEPITVEGVAAEILRYVDLHDNTSLLVDHRLAKDIAATFALRATPIAEPKLIRRADEPGYCHHREPYTLLENICDKTLKGSCPLFYDWMQRVKYNANALACFIGSIFVPESNNQQYLVLKGEGGDGKGAMLKCLSHFLGPTYAVSYGANVKEKSWTSETYQKRVVAFPDAQRLEFLNYEVFKTITGGDAISYRFLYQNAFTDVSHAKFIVCTNDDIDVTGMKSDRRRRIYVEMEAPKDTTNNYEKELSDEAPVFFSWCRTKYLEQYGWHHGPIKVDEELEDEMQEEADEVFSAWVDRWCNMHGNIRQGELFKHFQLTHDRKVSAWKRFKWYLRERKGIEAQRMDNQRWLKGISLKGHVAVSQPLPYQ